MVTYENDQRTQSSQTSMCIQEQAVKFMEKIRGAVVKYITIWVENDENFGPCTMIK